MLPPTHDLDRSNVQIVRDRLWLIRFQSVHPEDGCGVSMAIGRSVRFIRGIVSLFHIAVKQNACQHGLNSAGRTKTHSRHAASAFSAHTIGKDRSTTKSESLPTLRQA